MEPYEIPVWTYVDYEDPASAAAATFRITIKTPTHCPYCKEELRVAWASQGWGGHPFAFGATCKRCSVFLVRWRLAGFQHTTKSLEVER